MRRWRWLALVAAIGFIAALTLTPGSPLPFVVIATLLEPWVEPSTVEVVLNVLLFAPLGAVIARYTRPWGLLAAAAISIAIELAQGFLPERSPTLLDVVTNTIGACLGFVGMVALLRWAAIRGGAPATRDDALETAPRGEV